MLNSICAYFPSCGGCDFLNLTQQNYRELKQQELQKTIAASNFQLSSQPEWIWVKPSSRRKINLQVGAKNEIGFFSKKSNKLVEVENCFAAEKEISDLILPLKNFLKNQEQNLFTQVIITLFDNGLDLVFSSKKELNFSQTQKLTNFAREQNFNVSSQFKNQFAPIFLVRKNQIFYNDFKIDLTSEIFIQATKSGLESIVKIIRNFLSTNIQIKKVADIYAGFGAYSFAIQDLVKSILAFEGDEKMVDSINKNAGANNLGNKIKAEISDLFLSPIGKKVLDQLDLAIINPPRNGAAPQILEISKSNLKNLIYVSCNPASFALDAKILIAAGFKIINFTALDQFYSTKHLELIAIFQKF
jgi:23S rRNA (uracil1939-C5)-methyltransferase